VVQLPPLELWNQGGFSISRPLLGLGQLRSSGKAIEKCVVVGRVAISLRKITHMQVGKILCCRYIETCVGAAA
jgi:hypothetical protein